MTVLVRLIVMLGMLAIVPLGLRMLADSDRPWSVLIAARRFWPVGAVGGAACLWLPRGPVAGGLAVVYASAAALLVASAMVRFARRRSLAPVEIAVLTALVSPAVAASALVAERIGYPLFGFKPTVLTLTVAHFHFAGFAAALVAGLVVGTAAGGRHRRAADAAALTVPAGTLLVLVGYFTGDAVELAGATVLTAGMWTVAWLTWRYTRTSAADRRTATLLGVSAAVLLASMILALSWALGEATGLPHPSLAWMAATHGVANALGFALCAMVGWRRIGAHL
jgi:hypothetical protein